MILHSVCTTCSLIPYYHPHDIAFCVYNVSTYSILPSTWYCILFVQGVHVVHITIHMILHSVCTRSLIPYYHPHDIAFCVYNVFTYSILPSTWYCILCVQRVHLFHITIHMIVHSVCTTCSLIPYYHSHDSAFCLYNVLAYSTLPSTWYCILFVQHVHLFHITIHMILHSVTMCSLIHILPYIHMILHSVCTTCSLIPYYHPHDIAFCLYNVFTYSTLPSTWYCILFVQGVHVVHITIHMILHSVCTTCSLIPYYHPHDIAFCVYNVFTYSILPSTWYCILCVQRVHLFHITIHMIVHSVCTTCSRVRLFHITIHMIAHSVCTMCSLIPHYHPHGIAFCLYNMFTYSILPSTWYCILLQYVHLFFITIHIILHCACTTCSLISYYHPHDIAFCLYKCSHSPHYHPHDIAFCLYAFTYSILPSTWYCIVCTACSLIPYYHPHDIAFCLYNMFTYSILPFTW